VGTDTRCCQEHTVCSRIYVVASDKQCVHGYTMWLVDIRCVHVYTFCSRIYGVFTDIGVFKYIRCGHGCKVWSRIYVVFKDILCVHL
jgi:hypothetical protein